jgi:hypothetical protein
MLTDIQRAIRKYHNPNWTASFDAASAFLATANGMVYCENDYPDRGNWTYRMKSGADDKKYSGDQRNWADAMEQDGIFKNFLRSPISKRLKMGDVCYYAPGQTNKIGKVGKTSWDSFSYALQMAHNVWAHIEAVQEANRLYESGKSVPAMLVKENFNRVMFRDIVNHVFSCSDRGRALAAVDEYSRFYMGITGTRGLSGKKSMNAHSQYRLLTVEEDDVVENKNLVVED